MADAVERARDRQRRASGTLQHLVDGVVDGGADAVLAASIFHFGEHTVAEAKAVLRRRAASRVAGQPA